MISNSDKFELIEAIARKLACSEGWIFLKTTPIQNSENPRAQSFVNMAIIAVDQFELYLAKGTM